MLLKIIEWLIFNGESMWGTRVMKIELMPLTSILAAKNCYLISFLSVILFSFSWIIMQILSYIHIYGFQTFPPQCYLPGISSISSPYGITGFCFDQVGLTFTRNISREEKINKKWFRFEVKHFSAVTKFICSDLQKGRLV